MARRGGNTAAIDVPWSAQPQWTWHHDGYFVHGHPSAYAITLERPDGPLRIERAAAPVPVADGERRQEEARATAGMRWLDSTWQWNGPAIPDTKPYFSRLYVGSDGRIWVLRAGESVPRSAPETDENGVTIAWDESRSFDVFAPDGLFLGSVPAPAGFRDDRAPVFDAKGAWLVEEGPQGEPRVVRYRLQP